MERLNQDPLVKHLFPADKASFYDSLFAVYMCDRDTSICTQHALHNLINDFMQVDGERTNFLTFPNSVRYQKRGGSGWVPKQA